MNRQSSAPPTNSPTALSIEEADLMDELHARRAAHAARCNFDIHRLYADITSRVDPAKVRWAEVEPAPRLSTSA
jgi:hypothetical protein